jgi:hypothetical protein
MGDAGLTGRKIIVDTYGGMARHGGGAFSGKDPSKVDRSAAYAMRWVAKNVVAAGLATRCEVQVAYAIGKAEPVGVFVDCFGTETVPLDRVQQAIETVFDLRPAAIIRDLDLLPADLQQDRGLRALRPYRPRLPVGADRPRRQAPRRGGQLAAAGHCSSRRKAPPYTGGPSAFSAATSAPTTRRRHDCRAHASQERG